MLDDLNGSTHDPLSYGFIAENVPPSQLHSIFASFGGWGMMRTSNPGSLVAPNSIFGLSCFFSGIVISNRVCPAGDSSSGCEPLCSNSFF